MIPAGELQQLRRDANRLLPDTCVIRRPGPYTFDPAQGHTPGPSTDSAPVPCRVAPGVGREVQIGGGIRRVMSYTVTVPAETDVQGTDQVLWTDELGTEHVFEVTGVSVSSPEIVRRVLAVETT